MGRSVRARPPADEKESPEDQKPDEKRAQPSFRPSKQDPFYLGLREDIRKARRAARRYIDNARRRRRRAADPDHRDKRRAQSHGLSLQDYRAMRERQKNVCGICKTPGKPLCIDHCHATGKVRGLLCATATSASATTRTIPSLPGPRRPIWKPHGAMTGISGVPPARGSIPPPYSCSAGAGADAGESQKAAIQRGFLNLELQIHRTRGRRGEISRESTGKDRADPTCPLQAQLSGLPLNSTPWAEALIGGQAVVGSRWPSAGGARYRQTGGRPFRSAADMRTRSKRRSR